MEILAHRGYWNELKKANSIEAIFEALQNGYGFETDLRDYCGKLVVSHNIATNISPEAKAIFRGLSQHKDKCFAINIKADGLIDLLKRELEIYNISNYFTFDMSVPQMVEFRDAGLKFFTRQSEYEKSPIMYEDAEGVWIDGFVSTKWITKHLVESHLKENKKVCIVSPDLHKKEYLDFWQILRNMKLKHDGIMLCTDYPDEAKSFFGR